jgi:hypothetical protein
MTVGYPRRGGRGMRKLWIVAGLLVVVAQPAFAQDVTPVVAAPAPCCTIPALTEIQFEFTSTINSQANKIGETFPIRLSAPIVVDGSEVVPAGTVGIGEIIHAAKSRFGGKAGELILAVRSLDYQGTKIPLRSLRYQPVKTPGRGRDNGDTAAAVAIAGGAIGSVVSMFITGGEVNIPVGTIAFAKTSAPVTISPQQEGKTPQ